MKLRVLITTILFGSLLTNCTSPVATQPPDTTVNVIKFEEGPCPLMYLTLRKSSADMWSCQRITMIPAVRRSAWP